PGPHRRLRRRALRVRGLLPRAVLDAPPVRPDAALLARLRRARVAAVPAARVRRAALRAPPVQPPAPHPRRPELPGPPGPGRLRPRLILPARPGRRARDQTPRAGWHPRASPRLR